MFTWQHGNFIDVCSFLGIVWNYIACILMQQALFQKQSESGSLQMYPVTSVKNSLQTIHAISCKTTIYRYRVCRFGHSWPRVFGTPNAELWKKWAQRMRRWQHNWALRMRAKIYFSFRFKHYYRLTISAIYILIWKKMLLFQIPC